MNSEQRRQECTIERLKFNAVRLMEIDRDAHVSHESVCSSVMM